MPGYIERVSKNGEKIILAPNTAVEVSPSSAKGHKSVRALSVYEAENNIIVKSV